MKKKDVTRCVMCGSSSITGVFVYETPPAGEVKFDISGTYSRQISKCSLCGHFVSLHDMDMTSLYRGKYVDATYGGNGICEAYERIIRLPSGKSDNAGRAERVLQYAQSHFGTPKTPSVLDVGSGLCVFLFRMKQAGWECTALDPDERSAEHARQTVGVKSICADFGSVVDIGTYDVITFNKVLEHVEDPVVFLKRSREFLRTDGFVYVEVPDGEEAVNEGQGREEFFVDHHHVFSFTSLSILCTRAGFRVRALERLKEPSTKFTLRAFLEAR